MRVAPHLGSSARSTHGFSRAHELTGLGVHPAKVKELAGRLPAVQVIDLIDSVIEGEAEDVTGAGAIADKSVSE